MFCKRLTLYKVNKNSFIGSTGSDFIKVISPDNSLSDKHASSWVDKSNYTSYLNKIAGENFEIRDKYYGIPTYPACNYDFVGTFSKNYTDDNIVLTSNSSSIKGAITIPKNQIILMISGYDGIFTVTNGNQHPFKKGSKTISLISQTVGTNSFYSAALRDYLTGFNLGFYGNRTGNISSTWFWKILSKTY